ncbi:MAG: hypothetical protein WC436_04065 [Candidatus Babeliales bacterium]
MRIIAIDREFNNFNNNDSDRIIDCSDTNITDEGLLEIARAFPALKEINLRCCRGITLDGIQVLAHLCRALREMVIVGSGADCASRFHRGYDELHQLELMYPRTKILSTAAYEIQEEEREKEETRRLHEYNMAQVRERRDRYYKHEEDMRRILGNDRIRKKPQPEEIFNLVGDEDN